MGAVSRIADRHTGALRLVAPVTRGVQVLSGIAISSLPGCFGILSEVFSFTNRLFSLTVTISSE